jgi:hypothetical protein
MRGGDEGPTELSLNHISADMGTSNTSQYAQELETGKNSERNDGGRELRDFLNRQTPSGIYYNTRTGYHA